VEILSQLSHNEISNGGKFHEKEQLEGNNKRKQHQNLISEDCKSKNQTETNLYITMKSAQDTTSIVTKILRLPQFQRPIQIEGSLKLSRTLLFMAIMAGSSKT
jgi:type 1 fimbria pilin